jgi:hypothetical protein
MYDVYNIVIFYQKEGNYIIPTACLWSSTLYIRKKETILYLQCVYDPDFVYLK